MILNEEGYYAILGKSGARMEMPGCSLCMGNQAQIKKGSTAVSTSTRNFPNRLGIRSAGADSSSKTPRTGNRRGRFAFPKHESRYSSIASLIHPVRLASQANRIAMTL